MITFGLYILECSGGDRLCGRAATGLDIMSESFTNLPPHFSTSEGSPLTMDEWVNLLPGYNSFYPSSFHQVLPYLLATIVYHRQWLNENLNRKHPLFQSRLWRENYPEKLAPKVYSGRYFNKHTGMHATGVPSVSTLLMQYTEFRGEFSEFKEYITQRFDRQPDDLCKVLLEHFTVNGVAPLNEQRMKEIIRPLFDMIESVKKQRDEVLTANTPQIQSIPSINTFTWGGRYHCVPENFCFPTQINLRTLWDLWWEGNVSCGYAPYRFIKGVDLPNKRDKISLSKARTTVRLLLHYQSFSEVAVSKLPISDRDELFSKCFYSLAKAKYPTHSEEQLKDLFDNKRIGELTFSSIYDWKTALAQK